MHWVRWGCYNAGYSPDVTVHTQWTRKGGFDFHSTFVLNRFANRFTVHMQVKHEVGFWFVYFVLQRFSICHHVVSVSLKSEMQRLLATFKSEIIFSSWRDYWCMSPPASAFIIRSLYRVTLVFNLRWDHRENTVHDYCTIFAIWTLPFPVLLHICYLNSPLYILPA